MQGCRALFIIISLGFTSFALMHILFTTSSLEFKYFLSTTNHITLNNNDDDIKPYSYYHYEREIILKYWELRRWFQKIAADTTTSKNNFSSSSSVEFLNPIPEFFDFDKTGISLWGNGYTRQQPQTGLLLPIIRSRVIAQLVWTMQNEIRHYISSRKKQNNKAVQKRIYIGAMETWHINHLKAQYRETKRIQLNPAESEDSTFYNLAYNCALVTQVPKNWTNHDLNAIVTFAARGAVLHQRLIPSRSQIPWFKFTNEPPYIEQLRRQLKNQAICSYFRDSPIPFSYGEWIYYDPNIKEKWQKGINYAENKTEFGAIVVSNCHSGNGRLEYIRQLQNHNIPIDIFGKCGTAPCHDCFNKIRQSYKFYFSFENSNCRDYITEKLYRHALMNGVIPVVLGAHPDDYNSKAPHGSYIHVENFESPTQLALYLQKVSTNATLYNSYFNWRGTGEFIQSEFFQRLCPMLFYMETHLFPPGKWFQSIASYKINNINDNETMCLERGQWYWTRQNNNNKVAMD